MFELDKPVTLYYWCTPNGDKPVILLEELGLDYSIAPINILRGDQYQEDFLKVSPNNKIPALKQGETCLFESGAILLTLAELSGQFIPEGERLTVLQWLFWQMGGLGPMLGQNHHFNQYAPEKIPYAVERYESETRRLYKVLNIQLEGREYVVGEYSIADMAIYPWIACYHLQNIQLENYPHIHRWFKTMSERAAVAKAIEINQAYSKRDSFDESAREQMFKAD